VPGLAWLRPSAGGKRTETDQKGVTKQSDEIKKKIEAAGAKVEIK